MTDTSTREQLWSQVEHTRIELQTLMEQYDALPEVVEMRQQEEAARRAKIEEDDQEASRQGKLYLLGHAVFAFLTVLLIIGRRYLHLPLPLVLLRSCVMIAAWPIVALCVGMMAAGPDGMGPGLTGLAALWQWVE